VSHKHNGDKCSKILLLQSIGKGKKKRSTPQIPHRKFATVCIRIQVRRSGKGLELLRRIYFVIGVQNV